MKSYMAFKHFNHLCVYKNAMSAKSAVDYCQSKSYVDLPSVVLRRFEKFDCVIFT